MDQTARKNLDEQSAANVRHERPRTSDRPEEEHQRIDEIDFENEADLSRALLRLANRTRRRIREQPLTAATGAFIVGYAFGKGVPKFLARAGIAIGLRLVIQRMLEHAAIDDDADAVL